VKEVCTGGCVRERMVSSRDDCVRERIVLAGRLLRRERCDGGSNQGECVKVDASLECM
jgi:hypothetical protein